MIHDIFLNKILLSVRPQCTNKKNEDCSTRSQTDRKRKHQDSLGGLQMWCCEVYKWYTLMLVPKPVSYHRNYKMEGVKTLSNYE